MSWYISDSPISSFSNELERITDASLLNFAELLANQITPLIGVLFSFYMVLVCLSYLKGDDPEPITDLFNKFIGAVFIIGFGLNAESYMTHVIPLVKSLVPDLIIGTGLKSTSFDNDGTFDSFIKFLFGLIDKGFETAVEAGEPGDKALYYLVLLKASMIMLFIVPYLVTVLVAIIWSKIGISLVLALGPLFFGFLLFPVTRNYFSKWIDGVIQLVLFPLILSIIGGKIFIIYFQLFESADPLKFPSGYDGTLKTIFMASLISLSLLAINLLLFILLKDLTRGGLNYRVNFQRGTLMNGKDTAEASEINGSHVLVRGNYTRERTHQSSVDHINSAEYKNRRPG
jgi:type IV secretion system protein VirB6